MSETFVRTTVSWRKTYKNGRKSTWTAIACSTKVQLDDCTNYYREMGYEFKTEPSKPGLFGFG